MAPHLATVSAFRMRGAIARLSLSTTLIVPNWLSEHHLPSTHRKMSSQSQMHKLPLTLGATLCGQSGQVYTIREVLAERHELCVYRASAEGKSFIVKNLILGEYKYQQDLQKSVASSPNIRTMVDGIRGPELLVYPFLRTNFLQFSQQHLSVATRRSMLKGALAGVAALHERNIVHNDIKPNNILLDYEKAGEAFTVTKVQISDLEDAVILSDDEYILGARCGNQMWRSPESWARGLQGTPSDIFSFGVVCIYVMLNDMVLHVSADELAASDSWRHILRRHISFFGEEDGFQGLLQWIGEDNPFFERLVELAGTFNAAELREPFEKWHFVDAQFRDLVCRMTVLDPARRITAAQALEHPWFTASDDEDACKR